MPDLPNPPYPWGVAQTPQPERPRPPIQPVPQHGALRPLEVQVPAMDECATLGLAILRKRAGGALAVTLEVGVDHFGAQRMAWVSSPGVDAEDLPASVKLVLEALGWEPRNGNEVPRGAWYDQPRYETIWVYTITP